MISHIEQEPINGVFAWRWLKMLISLFLFVYFCNLFINWSFPSAKWSSSKFLVLSRCREWTKLSIDLGFESSGFSFVEAFKLKHLITVILHCAQTSSICLQGLWKRPHYSPYFLRSVSRMLPLTIPQVRVFAWVQRGSVAVVLTMLVFICDIYSPVAGRASVSLMKDWRPR